MALLHFKLVYTVEFKELPACMLKSSSFICSYNICIGATTDNLPPGVLYRVKATYKYSREDVDELSFDVGEIIRVVEYDDPEEQV